MAEQVIPEFNKKAFSCTRCGAYANQEWYLAAAIDKERAEHHGQTIGKGQLKNLHSRNASTVIECQYGTKKSIQWYSLKPM